MTWFHTFSFNPNTPIVIKHNMKHFYETHNITTDDSSLFINQKSVNIYAFIKQTSQDLPSTIIADAQQLTVEEVHSISEFAKTNPQLIEKIYKNEQEILTKHILQALHGEHRFLLREWISMAFGYLLLEIVVIFMFISAIQNNNQALVSLSALLIVLFLSTFIAVAIQRRSYYSFDGTYASRGATLFQRHNWSIPYSTIREIDLQTGRMLSVLRIITLDDEEYTVELTASIQRALHRLSTKDQWILSHAASYDEKTA